MPQFAYRARNAQGGLVEGVLDCTDRAVAIRQIELQQCIPIRIDVVGAEPKISSRDVTAPAPARQALKIPHGQLLVFTEQLAHLLQAGMTLDEGLSILEKRLKQPRVQQMTHALHQALIDGRSFSQALSEFPRIFPPLYTNMVAAGEASGALPQILVRLVKHLMQAKDLRDRVQQALIYPAFLALDGATLSAALQEQRLFPDLLTDMMAVGEQTGHFAETMQAIADVYERELDRTVAVISQLIPPVIIVVIAVLVGFVVYSILSAVFEMTHSLQFRPH